ncbi:MAG: hypothetical protein R3F49_23945 [Planctomycetota bacterium]
MQILALPVVGVAAATCFASVSAFGQATHRVSVTAAGVQPVLDCEDHVAVSDGGSEVLFWTRAMNLGGPVPPRRSTVYLWQASGPSLEQITTFGTISSEKVVARSISGDGRWVTYEEEFDVATNETHRSYLVDRATGVVTSAESFFSLPSGSLTDFFYPIVSRSGSHLAFWGSGIDLPAGGSIRPNVYVVELSTGVVRLASSNIAGAPQNGLVSPSRNQVALSDDGRWVAFVCTANNLVPLPQSLSGGVYRKDMLTGRVDLVSVHLSGLTVDGSPWGSVDISSDGRFVAWQSRASSLVEGDTNSSNDVFVRDMFLGETKRVSLGPGGAQQPGPSQLCGMSGDGRHIAFESSAGQPNQALQVFVHDRLLGSTALVSVSNTGATANLHSRSVGRLSQDGRFVAFATDANNMDPSDTNNRADIYLRDRGPQSIGISECGPAVANSTGAAAFIQASGSESALENRLGLTVRDLPAYAQGYFIMGRDSGSVPQAGGSQGTLCLSNVIGRLGATLQSSGPTGLFEARVMLDDLPANLGGAVLPGDTWRFQAWFRDSGGTSNFSDAVRVTFN